MGWRTDWLYGLIFAEFRAVWAKAQREGHGDHGPAPAEMLISEYRETRCSESAVRCCGGVLRHWQYRGESFEELAEPLEEPDCNPVRGMFYARASGAFNVSPDRKTVVLEYWFGPRYGRGFVYDVQGQGTFGKGRGQLTDKPNVPMWVS